MTLENQTQADAGRKHLPPKTSKHSETAPAIDPWEQTTAAQRAEVYTRGKFLADLEKVSARSAQITNEINADPDEVRKLRAALKQADAGKTRPYRKRATKSD